MKRTMKRGFSLLFALALALGATTLIPQSANADGDGWWVCHSPPGNPRNIQIIKVGSERAALAHLVNHGDTISDSPLIKCKIKLPKE